MTQDFATIIKANPALTTQAAVRSYIDTIISQHDDLAHYRHVLVDIVNTEHDDAVEVYNVPAMDGEHVSSTNGVRLLWMPEIGRAALNSYQAGDWQWTDAASPEDALRRFAADDMRP